MTALLAWTLAAILSGLAALHLYWALGGTKGLRGTVPSHCGRPVIEPGPKACWVVALLLAMAALLALWRGNILVLPAPDGLPRLGIWLVAAVFAGRAIGDWRYVGFFKRVRDTEFSRLDTRYFSPLCLVLAVLALSLALRP